MGYVLYGLVSTEYRSKVDNSLILTAMTYLNGGIEIAATDLDVKGGMNNKLLARLFTDGMFNVNAEDALFDFNYMRMAIGSIPTMSGEMITEPETVKVTVENTITVTGTPVLWNGELCGWYQVTGSNDPWKKITFVGQSATVPGLAVGQTVCVQYNVTNAAMRVITVPSVIVPETVYLTMRAGLFYAGKGTTKPSTRAGTLIIDVPNFQFSPNTTFSFDNSGASTTSLSGSALVDYSGDTSCASQGQYAYIKEVIFGRTPEDNLVNLAIDGADIQMKTNTPYPVKVIGIYADGTTGLFDNTRLTFTATPGTNVTVSNLGVISATQDVENVVLKVVSTYKTDIETYGNVTSTT